MKGRRGKKQFSTNKNCKACQRGWSWPYPPGREDTRVMEMPPPLWEQHVCMARAPGLRLNISGLQHLTRSACRPETQVSQTVSET